MIVVVVVIALVALVATLMIARRNRPVDARFVTFADAKYAATLRRIEREARGVFRTVHAYTEKDLDGEFQNSHASFVRDNPRGYGYWIWKPYVVRKAMREAREGEVVVYADAGCTIGSRTRLRELVATAKTDDGLVAFFVPERYDPRESRWTKREVLRVFGVENDESRQIMATAFLIKNTARNRAFVDEWYHLCSRYGHVDDTLSEEQRPEFSEHRHDQSLFSMLIKTTRRRDAIVLEDEIETHRARDAIRATRKKF
jgi:hypothetical protein